MKRHRAVLIISSLVVSITVCLWLVGSIYPRDPVVEALVWLGSSTAGDGVEISVTVEPGDGVSVIARRLEDAGLVNNASMFTLLVARQGHQKELKAGKYRLRQGMSLLELVEELRQGQGPDLVRVTIPEGLRAEEIADILARVGIKGRDEFVRLAKATDPSLSVPNGPPNGSSLEGYLFPDTYLVPPDISPREFIQLMLSNFDSRTSTVIGNPNSAFLRDIVTLASIVEREAKVTEERPIIAGVLLNRLAADMPLAADPTIQYALAHVPESVKRFGYWKERLTEADLRMDSPYNTYVKPGLPPGPICNPGLDSIKAVVSPQKSNYLFFVARPDGSHAFSATFEEHSANVARYRLQ